MDDPYDDHPRDSRDEHELREQDRFLPIANVARIMKKGIPETGKVHLNWHLLSFPGHRKIRNSILSIYVDFLLYLLESSID